MARRTLLVIRGTQGARSASFVGGSGRILSKAIPSAWDTTAVHEGRANGCERGLPRGSTKIDISCEEGPARSCEKVTNASNLNRHQIGIGIRGDDRIMQGGQHCSASSSSTAMWFDFPSSRSLQERNSGRILVLHERSELAAKGTLRSEIFTSRRNFCTVK